MALRQGSQTDARTSRTISSPSGNRRDSSFEKTSLSPTVISNAPPDDGVRVISVTAGTSLRIQSAKLAALSRYPQDVQNWMSTFTKRTPFNGAGASRSKPQ